MAVIELVQRLPVSVTAQIIAKQLVRSATSVGANYRAACHAKSLSDFICKMNTVEEESDESIYWLELLRDTHLANSESLNLLLKEADELTAIFIASGRTAKQSRS